MWHGAQKNPIVYPSIFFECILTILDAELRQRARQDAPRMRARRAVPTPMTNEPRMWVAMLCGYSIATKSSNHALGPPSPGPRGAIGYFEPQRMHFSASSPLYINIYNRAVCSGELRASPLRARCCGKPSRIVVKKSFIFAFLRGFGAIPLPNLHENIKNACILHGLVGTCNMSSIGALFKMHPCRNTGSAWRPGVAVWRRTYSSTCA